MPPPPSHESERRGLSDASSGQMALAVTETIRSPRSAAEAEALRDRQLFVILRLLTHAAATNDQASAA